MLKVGKLYAQMLVFTNIQIE